MNPIVQPIPGEQGRCYVFSRTEEGVKYLVDVFEYRGVGKCDCPQFRFRMQPRLEDGATGRHLQCWHIREAKLAFADQMIQRMLEQEKQENRKTRKI